MCDAETWIVFILGITSYVGFGSCRAAKSWSKENWHCSWHYGNSREHVQNSSLFDIHTTGTIMACSTTIAGFDMIIVRVARKKLIYEDSASLWLGSLSHA